MSHTSLKDTVNLPQTEFPIRAGLAQVEPALLEKWEQQPAVQHPVNNRFMLHDGPPYPNGNIHMGHALNKILKDIIVRFHTMNGRYSPYIPGWDCHGLPIETQVIKELQKNKEEEKKKDIPWFRKRCQDFALNYVETQKADFKRLGIRGQWDKPYLTLNPEYEANVLRLFGKMAENGLVYRGHKPIHWCTHCETALAEAEIEYADHKSPSIFVKFPVKTSSPALSPFLKNTDASFAVWTTTPWTLPSNVAVAAHPEFTYAVLNTNKGTLVVVEELVESLSQKLELEQVEVAGKVLGVDLKGTVLSHPFIDRESPVVTADYVTKEDGTGFVHIAPGHGQDDYKVGLEYQLSVIMPVDNKGRFTQEVGGDIGLAGQPVFEANKTIGQRLTELGRLLKLQFITHSYPHCWRCKNPVIFRATQQWFIALDTVMPHTGKTLRQSALQAIKETTWYPTWGENRITSMIENRPDWCISRQRFWGIPIPAFICKTCSAPGLTGVFNSAVVEAVKQNGTQLWFDKTAEEILPKGTACASCGGTTFDKETDILDVWFESGASFGTVLSEEAGTPPPADLYLEGSDQHRGWFQSSLLIGVGTLGKAPYKAVLTHGFLVDDKGRKMSKSMGNVIAPEQVIRDYGADVLRWWIASTDFKNDIAISQSILNQCRDSYSKVRNTLRFCLSNLFDFDASTALSYNDLNTLDQWALLELNTLIKTVTKHMEAYEFHMVTQAIHHFCAVTLSSMYLDMVKDRLYCGKKDGKERRSTQTVLHHILETLLRLNAPILAFTMEDAYTYVQTAHKKASIHELPYPTPNSDWDNVALAEKIPALLAIRDAVYQQLEPLRANKTIKSFLETIVYLPTPIEFDDWESFLIVSQVKIDPSLTSIRVEKLESDKCERCWRFVPTNPNHVCLRCEQAIHTI
jgi:isoleucyl-tRNA synthetase